MTPLQRAVDALNAAFAADPAAIQALLCATVPVNQTLADHPTVQVGDDRHGGYTLRPIGLMNGAIEAATGGRIAMQCGEPNEDGVCPVFGFQIWEPPTR